jgi:hypothetical protein
MDCAEIPVYGEQENSDGRVGNAKGRSLFVVAHNSIDNKNGLQIKSGIL